MKLAATQPATSGRRDETVSVASLTLKGGGQEGVGAASRRSPGGRRRLTPDRQPIEVCVSFVAKRWGAELNFEDAASGTDPLLSSPFQGEGPDGTVAFRGQPTELAPRLTATAIAPRGREGQG